MTVWHAKEEIVSWRGEIRQEWLAVPEASPPDAWENRPQDDTEDMLNQFETLKGPEMLGDEEEL
jgi:hypothetical protein